MLFVRLDLLPVGRKMNFYNKLVKRTVRRSRTKPISILSRKVGKFEVKFVAEFDPNVDSVRYQRCQVQSHYQIACLNVSIKNKLPYLTLCCLWSGAPVKCNSPVEVSASRDIEGYLSEDMDY